MTSHESAAQGALPTSDVAPEKVSTIHPPAPADADGPVVGARGALARVIVVSGPSGSGKSRLARQLCARHGWPFVNLDDFYRDHDAPDLPRFASGEIDWDNAGTWNVEAAAQSLERLCRTGATDVPQYSISQSRATGTHSVTLDGARFVVAEGIFAPDVIAPLAERGVLGEAWCLRRNRTVTAARRFIRDVAERRKPPLVLVRRGARLWRDEPELVRAHLARGAQPVTFSEAVRRAAALQSSAI